MQHANPYLVFQGNAEEVFGFYKSVFGGDFTAFARYEDFADMEMSEADKNKVAHVSLPVGSSLLMGSDSPESMPVTGGNNFSVAIEADSVAEADKLFEALAAGGTTMMPMGKTEWAEKFGMCTDRYGTAWSVSYTGDVKFG